jgi:hypothetical protein
MLKQDEHEDLRGSGRRSVIPYVHEREICIAVCVWRCSRLSLTCIELSSSNIGA